MKIVKYKNYINESQFVVLDNNKGGNMFKIPKYGTENSISSLNSIIKKFVEDTYGKYGFVYGSGNKDIVLGDSSIINTEYISKMVNNYTIFKTVIRLNNIKDGDSFYRFMLSNLNDIYSPNGNFFKTQSLPILINTSRRGNIFEKKAIEFFTSFAKNKGLDIIIRNPSIQEDIKGIDFIFNNKGMDYTVQVKPLVEYKYVGDEIFLKSNGSLSINTNYLILCNESECIILRNPVNDKIRISGDYFVTNQSNSLR